MAKFNQDGGGGAGGAAPAAPAAPAAAPAPSAPASASPAAAAAPASPASPPAGGAPPQPGPGASPTPSPAPAAGGKLIDTLPQRGSQEYWEKLDAMPLAQRQQVEAEWAARDSGLDAPPPEAPKADDPAAPLPGDKPKGEEEVFVTSETLDKLGKAPLSAEEGAQVKQVVETMQARIDELAPLLDPAFGAGTEIFLNDPIIKQRMEEIATGNPWSPGELAKAFDAKAYLTEEALQGIDFIGDPEGSQAKLTQLLQKAHEDGLRHGTTSAQYEMQQKVAFEQRKATFEKGFNDLISAHPELKAQDPNLKITDKGHPVKAIIDWAAVNLGDRFFVNGDNKQPFEAAYAAFLASGGKLNDAIKTTVVNSNLKFIRSLKDAQTHAATVGRNTPSAQPARPSAVPGLDEARYMSDPVYRQDFFNNADPTTRRKLEEISYGRKVTA